MLNRTPPIGAENVAVTPAAIEAASICLLRILSFAILLKNFTLLSLFEIQAARWTYGPSFPIENPAEIAPKIPIILLSRVWIERYLKIYTPARIDLSSGIPDPSACLLKYPAEAAIIAKKRENHTQIRYPPIKDLSSSFIKEYL